MSDTGNGDAWTTAGPDAPVAADVFREALRHHGGGVAVVTVAGEDGPRGFTVTSLTAASLRPPLLSFFVNHDSRSWPALKAADHLGVHLLGAAHRDLAALFARRGADRFAPPTRWWPGPGGVPLLTDATIRMICARREVVPVGDHFLVVGEVLGVERNGAGGDPLLYAHGEFGRWVPLGEAPGLPIDELDLADTIDE
ncbi:flavin reductase family protein [Planosporangium mesophilum]|uniref:Flavin-dependent reductase n=1 Tax=Planosporangium mesophilum TaxID=689768 RepID=A0A8J3WZM7_9ACTN|nr:flavin reductase family protein [Planosporangium mesophilum]NJC82669.1 flavin reductase family protein [Planosporangium mesophilum]GII21816.1 flavin-dependent reductase [Planosporangium mesophilum]